MGDSWAVKALVGQRHFCLESLSSTGVSATGEEGIHRVQAVTRTHGGEHREANGQSATPVNLIRRSGRESLVARLLDSAPFSRPEGDVPTCR